MKARRFLAATVLFATVAFSAAPAESALPAFRTIKDATGVAVPISVIPQRIVTLAPSLGELVADFLGGNLERIVGVTEYTDYPPALQKVKSVGSYSRVSLETVVSLKPDLVLATLDGNAKDQIQHLRELGLSVVVVGTEDFSEVGASMELVGLSLGLREEGERMRRQFETGIQRIRERAQKRTGPRPRVMLQVGGDPLVVVGKGSFLHSALEAVGATNLYGDSRAHYPRPSVEDVVARNPERIIVLMLGKDKAPFQAMATAWRAFPSLRAAKEKRIQVLEGDAVARPTLRLLEGLALLENAVGRP